MTGMRKNILFGFYALLMGLVLLYVLFPADAVRDHLANRINRNLSEAQVTIGSLRLGFPPALSLGDTMISRNGAVLLSMERLKLTPDWLSLFSSRKAFRFSGRTCQGKVSGSFWVASNNDGLEASASGFFSEISLEQVPALQKQRRIDLTGTLSGSFQADTASMNTVTGRGNILVSDGFLVPPAPLLNIQRFDFQRFEADFDFEGRALEIHDGELEGAEFDGTVSGSIYFETPFSGSEMELEIEVVPLLSSTASEANELKIRATGTFKDPKLTIVPVR